MGSNSSDAEADEGEGGRGGGERSADAGLVFVAAEAVALHCRGDLSPALYRLPDTLQPWQSLFISLGKRFACQEALRLRFEHFRV